MVFRLLVMDEDDDPESQEVGKEEYAADVRGEKLQNQTWLTIPEGGEGGQPGTKRHTPTS